MFFSHLSDRNCLFSFKSHCNELCSPFLYGISRKLMLIATITSSDVFHQSNEAISFFIVLHSAVAFHPFPHPRGWHLPCPVIASLKWSMQMEISTPLRAPMHFCWFYLNSFSAEMSSFHLENQYQPIQMPTVKMCPSSTITTCWMSYISHRKLFLHNFYGVCPPHIHL